MNTRRFGLLTGVLLGLQIAAHGDERARQMRVDLQTHAVPAETADQICACIEKVAHEGLPCEALTRRVGEGLVKQAPPKALQAAVEKRASALREAHALLAGTVCDGVRRPNERRGLCCLLAQALESGVPKIAFEGIFDGGKVCRLSDLEAVVEAGEMLHLAGIDSPSIRAFMLDCRERKFGRQKTLKRARARIGRSSTHVKNAW